MNTQQGTIIRFYIGLHSPEDTDTSHESVAAREARARRLLSDVYQGVTFYDATGVWEGVSEPTLVAEVVAFTPDAGVCALAASQAAERIRHQLKQDAVLCTITPTQTMLVERN